MMGFQSFLKKKRDKILFFVDILLAFLNRALKTFLDFSKSKFLTTMLDFEVRKSFIFFIESMLYF
jgi:hypothetical protein